MVRITVFLAAVAASLLVLSYIDPTSRSGEASPPHVRETAAVPQGGGEDVHFATSDNVVVYGTFYGVREANAPAVLCLHQWRMDRSSYAPLVSALAKVGIAVLVIDQRGHGKSVKSEDGKGVRTDRNTQKDVEASIGFLKRIQGLNAGRIGIVGASYGSSNAVIYAAEKKGVKCLVLLSPGLNYFNVLPTEQAIKNIGDVPMLAVASSEDLRSAEAVTKYKELHPKNITVQMYDNAGHGTEMFSAAKQLDELIVSFLKKNL